MSLVWYYAPGKQGDYTGYPEVAAKVDRSLVVLADSNAARIAPAFGVRVVASPRPFPFVHDGDERREAMQSFFSSLTSLEIRRQILTKYAVDRILVSRSFKGGYAETPSAFAELADVVVGNDRVTLLKVRAADLSSPQAATPPD